MRTKWTAIFNSKCSNLFWRFTAGPATQPAFFLQSLHGFIIVKTQKEKLYKAYKNAQDAHI